MVFSAVQIFSCRYDGGEACLNAEADVKIYKASRVRRSCGVVVCVKPTSAKLCALGNRKSQCCAPVLCGLSQSTQERMGDWNIIGFQQEGAQERAENEEAEEQVRKCTWW